MKRNFKNISGVILIVLGFLPLLILLSFQVQKKIIRHQMIERLERQHLQTITVPENEVVWVEKHEIWINDHMFDIKTSTLENGIYVFTGLYDDEETELIKNHDKATRKHKEENNLLSQFFKWVQSHYVSNDNVICLTQFSLNSFNSFEISFFPAFCEKVPTPPPRGESI